LAFPSYSYNRLEKSQNQNLFSRWCKHHQQPLRERSALALQAIHFLVLQKPLQQQQKTRQQKAVVMCFAAVSAISTTATAPKSHIVGKGLTTPTT